MQRLGIDMLLLLGLLLHANLSLQEKLAAQTTCHPVATPDLAPTPTKAPVRRADTVPVNICGWFSGSGYGKGLTYNLPLSLSPFAILAFAISQNYLY
jgi:hypothetical protein